MEQVLDYSAGLPGAKNIRAAGYAGAVRYIGLPGFTKCTTRAELADFEAHGLGMALVWEHFATDWRGGYQAGRANMARALDHAYAIGWPADRRPIYMAVDQDVVSPVEFDAAMEYLDGAGDAHQGPGSTGPYGEHDVCARSADAGFAWQWQCRAWSGTPIRYFPGRRLFQQVGTVLVGGIACDINDIHQADWGQHQGGDMPLTRADLDQIRDVVRYEVLATRDPNFLFDGRNPVDLLRFNAALGNELLIEAREDEARDEAMAAQTRVIAASMSDSEGRVLAAIRDLTTGVVDPAALATALAPLLPAPLRAALADLLRRGVEQDAG